MVEVSKSKAWSPCSRIIAEHACDDVSKRLLKLPTYQLQIVLVNDQHL